MDSNFVLFKCISMYTGAWLHFNLYAINTYLYSTAAWNWLWCTLRARGAYQLNWTFDDGYKVANRKCIIIIVLKAEPRLLCKIDGLAFLETIYFNLIIIQILYLFVLVRCIRSMTDQMYILDKLFVWCCSLTELADWPQRFREHRPHNKKKVTVLTRQAIEIPLRDSPIFCTSSLKGSTLNIKRHSNNASHQLSWLPKAIYSHVKPINPTNPTAQPDP